MRPSDWHRPPRPATGIGRAPARRLAFIVGVLLLAMAILGAPFAGSSGFAAPPHGALAPATVPAGRGSLRPRGAEAPERPTPAPVTPTPTPATADPTPKTKRATNKPDRVWPLKADSFTFTQPFGCVHQIANFYAAAPGCPPDRPVFHTGIDLSAPLGTKIYAAASGWVTHAGPDRDSGLANSQIIIQHDGVNRDYGTEYLHWQAAYVREGDYVRSGQPIAEVGSVGYSTGPHLHFSVIDFRTNERIDPMTWLPKDHTAGGYLGLAPDAKRFPIASKSKAVPDYADPAPPPPPAQERVPKHDAKKAAKGKAGKQKRGGGKRGKRNANADATPDASKHTKRHNRNDHAAAGASETPTPDAANGSHGRRSDRTNRTDGSNNHGNDATPPADSGKHGKGSGGRRSSNDGAAPPPDPTATPAPVPSGPGTNLPPPVPPVPGVPAPLVPGATVSQPAPTATPDAGRRGGGKQNKQSKHDKQKQKRQKADSTKQA
ncbi:MAG TPA: M23 family metallopeptidase [Thermomicrobiales bacterium]|nr:M23 family metallopeptidase [Thermomicrobiales bacterium]